MKLHLAVKGKFWLSVKTKRNYLGFALLRTVIGPEIRTIFLTNQIQQ